MKQNTLITYSMCIDLIDTYDIQQNINSTDSEKLMYLIFKYISKRDVDMVNKIPIHLKNFFMTNIKKRVDLECEKHNKKSKQRMVYAYNARKKSDDLLGIKNEYTIDFNRIGILTKLSIPNSVLKDIAIFINIDMQEHNIKIENDASSKDFLFSCLAFLNYAIYNVVPNTEQFKNSYANFVFNNIKKQVDKHNDSYKVKIDNLKKKGIKDENTIKETKRS